MNAKEKKLTGFIGLRPKCYAFKIHGDGKEYKKCKGTAKNTVKRKNKYDDYNKVLEINEVIHRSFNSIRSKSHKIYSIVNLSTYRCLPGCCLVHVYTSVYLGSIQGP